MNTGIRVNSCSFAVKTIAKQFKRAKAENVTEILETLVTLGLGGGQLKSRRLL